MSKYNFNIIIEQDEDGMYIVTVPALKSCYTQAKSIDELYIRIKEVIELCLEVEEEHKYLKDDYKYNKLIKADKVEVSI